MASNACWGIEIGAAAIKAIKLEAEGEGKCRVVDYAIVPHPKVLSTPGIDANDVIRLSLGQLTNQVELGNTPIAVSIPGHSGFARFAKLPPVEPSKVGGIVEFEARQQVPFPLDQVEWDYQTFVTPDSPEVEVGIFAVTKERVNERLQMLADAGVTPSFVVLSPIAVYNALSHDLEFGPKTASTIIVDIGTTSTDLVIATPGRMWVRTFPLGGHQFTEALVNQFQLSYPKAEKLKREAQDTKHARQVFQAMRPVFTDLAQDIQRSIGYFQSLNKDAELTRLIGVGNTWRLPGLRKYLKQQLGMDVYRIETFKKIGSGAGQDGSGEDSEEGGSEKQIDPNDKNAVFADASLSLCTAYGLALHGLGMNLVGGNLMPVSVVRGSMWKDKVKWFGLAAGVAAAAGAVMFLNPVRNYFAVGGALRPQVVAEAVNRSTQVKAQAAEAGVLEAGNPDLRAANLINLEENRAVYNLVMADIGRIFEAADNRKSTWAKEVQVPGQTEVKMPEGPALSLGFLRTDYVGPSSPSGASPVPETMDSSRPFVPETIREFPVIVVTMQAVTSVPEARRFIGDTVVRWLRQNSTREGIPYEVVFVENEFGYKVVETKIAENGAIAGGGELSQPPQGGGAGEGDRDTRPGRGPGRPTGQRGPVGGGDAPQIIGEGGGGTSGAPQAGDDIEAMAPLTPPAESAARTGTAVFQWYMAFKPLKPKEAVETGSGVDGAGGAAGAKSSGGGS